MVGPISVLRIQRTVSVGNTEESVGLRALLLCSARSHLLIIINQPLFGLERDKFHCINMRMMLVPVDASCFLTFSTVTRIRRSCQLAASMHAHTSL